MKGDPPLFIVVSYVKWVCCVLASFQFDNHPFPSHYGHKFVTRALLSIKSQICFAERKSMEKYILR
jgi:hypothetical protein